MYFLAGNYGGTTVRECTVPATGNCLFPLFNQSSVPVTTIHHSPSTSCATSSRNRVDNPTLACEVDGRTIQNLLNYREQSSVFSVTVPEGNLLGLNPGTYAPCLDDGYYLLLAPLSRGQHTIHFTAENADHSFSLDVTYHLTVK